MKNTLKPDAITKAACRWLLSGAEQGTYVGPDPGNSHDLTPLLSKEFGREEITLKATAVWFRQEQIVRSVLKKIDEMDINLWAVKGFDLARSVYPFPAGRPMCDADLFIEARHRQTIMAVFHQAGWSRISPGDGIFSSGIVSEMKMLKQGILAELHSHIFYFPATFPGKLPIDLFENGRFLESGLYGFAWHNALLLVIIHLLTHDYIKPVWWADICLLSREVSKNQNWEKFTENAYGTKLCSHIAFILSMAVNELDAPIPEKVVTTLRACSSNREGILGQLKSRSKAPTLLNLTHLRGWKRISWFFSVFWLFVTGQQPFKHE